jgi:hypothetical protein
MLYVIEINIKNLIVRLFSNQWMELKKGREVGKIILWDDFGADRHR